MDRRIRQCTNIHESQFGFMPGRSTTDFNQYTTVTFEFCTALDLINVFYSQVETKGK